MATRCLVKVLLSVGLIYEMVFKVSRGSEERELIRAYKRLILKVHPDKGGDASHFRRLQEAKENWDAVRASTSGKAGRPASVPSDDVLNLICRGGNKRGYRISGRVVLLTYQGPTGLQCLNAQVGSKGPPLPDTWGRSS